MNDIDEITVAAPTAQVARPTLHLKRSAPSASLRVRPVVRIFPRKSSDHPKSAAFVSSDVRSRPASWNG
jgi:hypothetical protein